MKKQATSPTTTLKKEKKYIGGMRENKNIGITPSFCQTCSF
jgi:hypothetical protein